MDKSNDIKKTLKEETEKIKNEARERILGYFLTALGLVAAFAWNDAVKSLIEYFFPLNNKGLWAKFGYALVITLIVVIFSIYANNLFKQNQKDKN